jgi:hypothetical protein
MGSGEQVEGERGMSEGLTDVFSLLTAVTLLIAEGAQGSAEVRTAYG